VTLQGDIGGCGAPAVVTVNYTVAALYQVIQTPSSRGAHVKAHKCPLFVMQLSDGRSVLQQSVGLAPSGPPACLPQLPLAVSEPAERAL
jgi:hypothetical protein